MTGANKSSAPLADRWQTRLKNKPVVALLVVATAVVAGLATWADSFGKLKHAFLPDPPTATANQPTVQINPRISVNPHITVNPTINGAPTIGSSRQSEQIRIAEDHATEILATMHADKVRVLDAIANRSAKGAKPNTNEDLELRRAEAEYTSEFRRFSDQYDDAVKRFKSSHKSYIEALKNNETLRANNLRNKIHEEQLQFQLDVLIARSDGGINLTDELSRHIVDRFAGHEYVRDPIPTDPLVKEIVAEAQRASNVSIADAAKLPAIEEASTPGMLVRASGLCAFLKAGATTDDRSVMVLTSTPSRLTQPASRIVVWFEWGWRTPLTQACRDNAIVSVVGFFAGEVDGAKVLRDAAIPGQQHESFLYYDPHRGRRPLQ